MSGPDPVPVPGADEISVLDVVGPDVGEERLRQLQQVHARHFPDYPHVLDELEHDWAAGSDDPLVVVHQLLLLRDGAPVGEFIVHTNLRRGMVLRHHLAIDRQARAGLPFGWLRGLTGIVAGLGGRDGTTAGRSVLGMISEISPEHLEGWRRMGYRTFDVGYAEPVHGRGWAAYGPLRFHSLLPIVGLLPDGEGVPFRDVALAGVSGFLLDHYRLPADEPVVAEILRRTAELPPDG